MPQSSSKLWAWGPVVAYMALIWGLSSISQPPVGASIPYQDKVLHFIEYGGLSVLLARGLLATYPALGYAVVWRTGVALTSLWGLIDEIHQAYVPGRSSEAADVAADFVGALVWTGAYLAWRRWRASRKAPRD